MNSLSSPGNNTSQERLTRYENHLFNLIAYFLFVPVTAKTTDGLLFSVRQANGVDQHYQLIVPPDLQPAAPVNPRAWVTPGAATNKISAKNATIVAVAWAGGLSKREKGGPPNSLIDVGGSPARGFLQCVVCAARSG
jgi:hypothetical protein